MANPHQHIDYAASFPHRVPTKIQGEPLYRNLKRLKTELRANASSVDTDLGGGNHGYLGLVLSRNEYPWIWDPIDISRNFHWACVNELS